MDTPRDGDGRELASSSAPPSHSASRLANRRELWLLLQTLFSHPPTLPPRSWSRPPAAETAENPWTSTRLIFQGQRAGPFSEPEGCLQSGAPLCGSRSPCPARPQPPPPQGHRTKKGSLHLGLHCLLPLMKSLGLFFFLRRRSQDVEEPNRSAGSDTGEPFKKQREGRKESLLTKSTCELCFHLKLVNCWLPIRRKAKRIVLRPIRKMT